MSIQVFTGNANRRLALSVVKVLDVLPGRAMVERFPDEEVRLRLGEGVRGNDIYMYSSAHRRLIIT